MRVTATRAGWSSARRSGSPPGRRLAAALMCCAALSVIDLPGVMAAPWLPAAAPLELARGVRSRGCGAHDGIRAPLRDNTALDAAAGRWSSGTSLKSAIQRSGYRDEQSAALHVDGDAAAVRQALALRLCVALTDASFVDLGSAQRGHDSWIIVAAPFAPPPAADAARVGTELLQRINAARAQGARCGRTVFAPAPPLRPNALLSRAALAHARDMLDHDHFAHAGHDGSTPAARVGATGYRYRIVGENIASGPETAAEAVRGWLASPAHCQNIMDPRFHDSGIAYAANDRGAPRIYWVQDFAAPR